MRGDEPDKKAKEKRDPFVCPTCVGMNRILGPSRLLPHRLPHMRGEVQ